MLISTGLCLSIFLLRLYREKRLHSRYCYRIWISVCYYFFSLYK